MKSCKQQVQVLLHKANVLKLCQRKNSTAAAVAPAICPHSSSSSSSVHDTQEWKNALPYDKVPGPRPIPILGNNWRWVNEGLKLSEILQTKQKI